MDYFFGDGAGEPTQWQGAPDLTLGAGAADGLWLDFDGDGYADDALWDSDLDGVADRVVTDVGTGGQEVYSDDGGRGVWNVHEGGAGALVAGPAVAGPAVAGSEVMVGSGAAGSATGGAADAEVRGSLPDWGSLLAEAVGALDQGSLEPGSLGPGSLGPEAARWTAPPVIEPEPGLPVQRGTIPVPAPPVLESDGSLTVDIGSGLLSVADADGDGHLDSALPASPLPPTGSPDAGAVGGGS